MKGRAAHITALGRTHVKTDVIPTNVEFVRGDFTDTRLFKRLLDQHDIIVHLAYATVPNTSFDDPLGDLQQNLAPAVRLFTETATHKKKLILVSSGGTVYGEATKLPIPEDHPTRPISPYGVTKLTLENYAYLFAMTHGLQFVCVRPSNAYGPGQRPFVGQGFIATAMASAMKGESIKIFGRRGAVRDYLYITDLAEGIACLLSEGQPSQTYNLGSGQGMSNMDVIESLIPLLREFGHELKVEHLPERPFDVKANVLDINKVSILTGWKPKVSFEQGLRSTYEWLSRQPL